MAANHVQVIGEVLQEHYVLLTENLDCTELIGWLYEKKSISQLEKETVEACGARHERTRKFLDILRTKDDVTLNHMLEFLHRDGTQLQLLTQLETSKAKWHRELTAEVEPKGRINSKRVLTGKWWPEHKKLINGFLRRTNANGELLIKAVHDQLHSSERRTMVIVPRTQTFVGMGGVGKTSMAKWYANGHEEIYDQIIWIDSDGQSLQSSFEHLAISLKISLKYERSEMTKSIKILAEEVFEKLADSTCLFIFDNVDEGYEKVSNVLPKKEAHFVIITSRIQDDWGHANEFGCISTFSVDIFTKEECLALFATAPKSGALKCSLPSDDEVKELGKLLGFLPLALQCAIATITSPRSRFTFASYLERLKADMTILTEKKILGDYAKPISVALRLSLEQIENDSKSSESHRKLCKSIIGIAAYCHPDELFEGMFAGFPNVSKYQIEDAVEDLVRHSLLSVDEEEDGGSSAGRRLRIHRLLQEVMKQTLKQDSDQECETLRSALLCFQTDFNKYGRSASATWLIAMEHETFLMSTVISPSIWAT